MAKKVGRVLGGLMSNIRRLHRSRDYAKRNEFIRRYDDLAFARWKKNHG